MADHPEHGGRTNRKILLLAACFSLGACSGSPPAGVDAVVSTYANPNTTPQPSPTADGLTGNQNANVATDGNSPLAVIQAHAATAALPGINLSPRLAINECLDILDAKPQTALPLQLYYCNGIPAAQEWEYIGGRLQIDGTWCLDVSSAQPDLASNAVLNNCDSTRAGQFWNFVDGMLQIAGTNVCLMVPDANATIEKYILVGACDANNARHQWGIANYTSGGTIGVTIANQADPDSCLDVYGGTAFAGAVVDIYSCNASSAQQWIWQGRMLQALGECLEAGVDSASMQPCDPTNAQQQWVTDQGRIKLFGSESCVDLNNGNATDGTPLTMSVCSDAASQQWNWGAP